MRRHHEIERSDAHDANGRTSTPLMALALFAGVVAGAAIAHSRYRDEQRRSIDRRERIERWEGEGGALPETVGTGGAASPRPGY
jgi:hypothetical protein